MRFVIIGASVLCAALIGLAVFLSINSGTQKTRIIALHSSAVQREEVGAWVSGASEPEVTLVEYADLQCPGCAAMHPIVQEAMAATGDFVQLQYKHYLIPSHNKARLGAQAVEAAGRQGKFSEMTSYLFTTQSDWLQDTPFAFKDMVTKYAGSLNLNLDQFKNDLNDSSVNRLIDQNVTEGNAVPVTGTPTLIINGTRLSILPRSSEQLITLLEAARVGDEELQKAIESLASGQVATPAQEVVAQPAPAQ